MVKCLSELMDPGSSAPKEQRFTSQGKGYKEKEVTKVTRHSAKKTYNTYRGEMIARLSIKWD